jgi:hypothetical protein
MKKLIIMSLIISLFLAGCSDSTTPNVEPEYQLIELEDVENDEVLEWYESNKGEMGTYQLEADEAIYLLISAGEKRTGGYSLEIENDKLEGNTFSGELTLITPKDDDMVTMALTYPTLLIKFSGLEEVDTDFNLEELEEVKEKGLKQVIAKYIGQIDNNSIEVDTSMSAQLQPFVSEEQVLALRISESQLDVIEALETDDFLVFNVYQDEHDRFIISEILEYGELSETYILEATYIGRFDNNSIEVTINNSPVAFRYTTEQENEDIGEIETDSLITIKYSFNEHGQRVADEIMVIE